jgi:peptide deformylase
MRKKLSEILPIRFCGDPVLRKRAEPVIKVTAAIRELAERMIITMYENEIPGIGLAAPQVGVDLRLITLAVFESPEDLPPNPTPGEVFLASRMPLALINPEIVWASPATDFMEEGCLSIPKLCGEVERPALIIVRASTLDGESFTLQCGNLLGRCIQHEIDHLNGVLFIDRLRPEVRAAMAVKIEELEKRTNG